MLHRISAIISLVVLCVPLQATAQPIVRIKGRVTFEYEAYRGMADVNPGGGRLAFPINTRMRLYIWDGWLTGWQLDKNLEVSNTTGDYSVLTNADPDDQFKIRVYLQTLDDLASQTLRINMGGYGYINDVLVAYVHWFETTPFTTATAAQPPDAPPTLTVHMHVGSNSDADAILVDTSHNPIGFFKREMALSMPEFHDEEDYRRFAIPLKVIDEAYRLVDGSGKLPWLGAGYSNGQHVYCPPRPIFSGTAGIAWPATFSIHLRDSDGLSFGLASHEFGHVVHYHTTDISMFDLWREALNNIWPYWGKNALTAKIAYVEGWAEYFATMHRHESVLTPKPTYSNWVENDTHPPRGLYWHYWKAADDDGTTNSGEKVMGAVAQAFWKFSPPGGSFADRIEDVWAAVRMGATAGSRNSRKTLKEFYDAIMVLHSGSPQQQKFRNICDVHGLVFSRMKLTEFEPVANSGAFVPATDNVWLSANSRLKAAPLTADELMVTGVVEAEVVGYQIHPPGSANPYVWASVPYTDLTGPTWDGPDYTFTEVAEGYAVQGYRAILAAATAGLDNRYYLVRAAVKPPGVGPADEFVGPVLETPAGAPDPGSGKHTAEWWRELGINYVVKIDKVKPEVETSGRRPPANP